jgi:predicted outer membrane repeat protein
VLENLIFTRNFAANGGGAIYFDVDLVLNLTLTNVVFKGNRTYGYGGAIQSYMGNFTFINCLFSGNTSDQIGGAIHSQYSTMNFINATFNGNSAEEGGAIYGYGDGAYPFAATLVNSIIWENSLNHLQGNTYSSFTVSYSNVGGAYNGGANWLLNGVTDGGNNIDRDPLFVTSVSPSAEPSSAGDLRLQSGSPCINVGNNSVVMATTDLDGNPRIVNGTVDMGPYEYQGAAPTTHTVTYSVVNGNGTLGASVDGTAIASGAEVVEGKDVLFNATPDSGYQVKAWTLNGGMVADNTSTSYTAASLAGDIIVTVEFELIPPTTHTVTYSVVNGNGTLGASVDGTAIASGAEVVEGKDVLFNATPDSGYQVKAWTLNGGMVADNTSTSYTAASLAGDITVTVEFELIPPTTHTVTYSVVNGNGTLGASVDGTAIASGAEVVEGKDVLFNATPDSGYQVKAWTLNGGMVADNTSTSYTAASLAGDITVTVEFELIPPTTHTVTYSVVNGNGTLGASVDGTAIASGAEVVEGKDVLFNATPDSGYQVKAWTLNGGMVADNTSTSYTAASLAGDITVTVEFELIPPTTHTVTYSVVNGNGTLGASVDGTAIASGAEVVEGKDVLFNATPDRPSRPELKWWKAKTSCSTRLPDINGTLGASVDGTAIASGAEVVEGKDVLFGQRIPGESMDPERRHGGRQHQHQLHRCWQETSP